MLDQFARPPWTSRYLQGHIDAPFINLTPGTRTGFVYDSAYATLCESLQPLEQKLIEIIEEQRCAEEEQASREQLRTIQRAFREALLALPAEEYDWFDIQARSFRSGPMARLQRQRTPLRNRKCEATQQSPELGRWAKTGSSSFSSSPDRCSAW